MFIKEAWVVKHEVMASSGAAVAEPTSPPSRELDRPWNMQLGILQEQNSDEESALDFWRDIMIGCDQTPPCHA